MNCSIVGLSVRLPENLSRVKFWNSLLEMASFTNGMSAARRAFHNRRQTRPWGDLLKVKGMYLDDIDCFDKRLFNLSNPALIFADPRQRLLLESCWAAIEDAGLRVSELKGKKVGVFLAQDGFDWSSYFHNIPEEELGNQEFIIPGTISSFLASRIANVFDFRGPSMVIDATCSSIYIAIHHACQALEKQECDYALVGGATLFLEPWRKGEIRPTSFETGVGEIKSFSKDADGYCSSEGCGAFLLQRDLHGNEKNNNSYGTIIATGNNSGGKTGSFAQPSQEQQEILFRSVLKEAGKVPTDIDYIECHGIGAAMGDAMEGNAFINVFGRDNGSCYVSTIKPNIGHAQASSGLYSLLKVLLAIKYRKIPGIRNLESENINTAIPADKRGIRFLTQQVDWAAQKGEKRLALLCTYGASNVNAALIVKEPDVQPLPPDPIGKGTKVLICLSAETKEQLNGQRNNLFRFIESEIKPVDIYALAYTLQTGREQLRYRFAVEVADISELRIVLQGNPLQEHPDLNLFSGDKRSPDPSIASLMENKAALDELLVNSFKEKNLGRLAQLWVNGINIKWEYCYKGQPIEKLHLPTYPFARDRYWLPEPGPVPLSGSGGKLHPLLHENTSDIHEQRFTSVFTGKEAFLVDHVVRGMKVLPGVAYLELIRTAGTLFFGQPITHFKNILWLNQISVKDDPKKIHISLFPEKDAIGYEIYSHVNDDGSKEVIHGQGSIAITVHARPAAVDIAEVKTRLHKTNSGEACYAFYDKLGLALGNTYKGLEVLFNNEDESLGKISIPRDNNFVWQPGILDSTFQTGDLLTLSEAEGLRLPFCIKEICVYGDVAETKWAYARKIKNENEPDSRICSHDIDMLSENGDILMSLKGFVTLPLDGFQQQKEGTQQCSVPIFLQALQQQTETVLLKITAGILRLDARHVATDEKLGDYGFDSVMMTLLANALNTYYDLDLLPTVFYTYPTIQQLSSFLVTEYATVLNKKYEVRTEEPQRKDELIAFDMPSASRLSKRKKRSHYEHAEISVNDRPTPVAEPVAIIGMSGRFPGSPDLHTFWENIRDNKDLVIEAPADRWDWREGSESEGGGIRWGGFITDIDKFDPLFFGISPLEAEMMDPQQRITLEAVYHALEDAALPVSRLKGSNTGVFIGVSTTDYGSLLNRSGDNISQAQYSTGLAHSVLANRVSYLFDWHGPSEPVDTACSSSLVAIHKAVEAIRNGHADIAIAGGVNALLSTELSLSFQEAGMLSPDGRCKTFDQRANGYVRGEGVGFIVLKSLSKAIADGDRIQAVVRSSSQNHGGSANTLTSPNPNAQKELLLQAYRAANIDPRDVSYIEAHGTGTRLGDPIETEGLKYAFKQLYEDRGLPLPAEPHIRLGSVKTNIGHLEAAAGIAGVLKVVQSIKNKQLPGNLHLLQANKYLKLENSPFLLQKDTTSWQVKESQLRLAGISSFGFSGTNAHVLLEEYVAAPSSYQSFEPAVIVLSARSADRLRQQASNLQHYIDRNAATDLDAIAYTLQTGREAMEHRLAIVASDLAALSNNLARYVAGDHAGLFTGIVGSNVAAGKEPLPAAQRAAQWVNGVEIDWSIYYKEGRPSKLSLPGYPFARERYWIDAAPAAIGNAAAIHPLVHYNHSSLEQQRYQSVFTGRERFLLHHVIEGRKVFPGAAYLELARAAGSHSLEKPVTQLRDIVWLTPLVVNGRPEEVQISIYREGDFTGYEIYTGVGESEQLHSQGRLVSTPPPKVSSWYVAELQAGFTNRLTGEGCYRLFEELGFAYGPSHRGIDELWYKQGSALSRIRLTAEPGYELSPGMVDSVLQSCLGVVLGTGINKLERQVPYSAGELSLYAALPEEVWCYVRRRGGQVDSYDIDVMNASGEVLLAIRDFVALGAVKSNGALSAPTLLYYESQWRAKAAVENAASSRQALILLAGGPAELADLLTSRLEAEVELLSSASATDYFMEVLQKLKPRMTDRGNTSVIVLYERATYSDHSFITGLLRTAQQEHPGIQGKTVGVTALSVSALESLIAVVETELEQDAPEVRYINGQRQELRLEAVQDFSCSAIAIKEGGVYLLTGGVGGLGSLFATHLSKLKAGRLILTGRSELSAEKAAFVSSLGIASYYRCDVSVREEVAELLATIKREYGQLNGILHAAGVIRDSFIIHKREAEALDVFSSKVHSTRHLDELSRQEPLDFMVLFSSLSGVLGNVGQGDYASANAWLDRYALHRNELVNAGQRSGRTVSINWPLWSSVGLQPDEASRKRLEQEWGLLPLPAAEGLRAFEMALNSGMQQVIVAYGFSDKITEVLHGSDKAHNTKGSTPLILFNKSQSTTSQWLHDAAFHLLRKEVAGVLKLPVGKLEADEPFERYGINSLLVARLTNHLDGIFGRLPRTLFFEYQNLRDLVGYFLLEHSSRLEELTSRGEGVVEQEKETASLATTTSQATALPRILRRSKQQPAILNAQRVSPAAAGIAIIGLSGRYPGARDIGEFWQQLRAGQDCITEIPKDRWEIAGFYDPDKDCPGSSYGKWGGFIDDVACFDPLFFNISPRDAEFLDPQERLFLQTAWETIEDAGYTRSTVEAKGLVGVYVGVMYEEYQLFGAAETQKGNPLTLSGSAASIANRVSYFMNLHGPSMAIDTMCSSSLTSIHLACENLRSGSIKMALAGGVNISVHPNKYRLLSERRFMSEKGRCESFGEGGEGYVPGEGVGAVLLKPLDAAIADGDRIYGVIRGSSINHGGKTNGYTVPNPVMQSEVIRAALEQGGIKSEDVSYIEAHGTGTSLGDPIEIAGLSKIFGGASAGRVCAIGSVKSNIGHCESAAGIAGVTKVLLQMEHKQLAPSLHSETLNVNIDFSRTPFRVQQRLENWEVAEGRSRVAGISSFGAGGSNAHVIIEEYIPASKTPSAGKAGSTEVLVLLSAKQEKQLQDQVTNLLEYIKATGDAAVLEEIAYTLQTGREAMEERLAILCRDPRELTERLRSYSHQGAIGQEGVYRGNTRLEKETIELLQSGQEGVTYLETLLHNKRLGSLGQLWVKGVSVNWLLLYAQGKPRKTALPAYPFERTKYWFQELQDEMASASKGKLNPLLHYNSSNLKEQRFTSEYSGLEPFLQGHRVKGEKVLPGVAYLELAREAGSISMERPVSQIKDITWLKPLSVNGHAKQLHIRLFEEGNGVTYEAYSLPDRNGEEEIVHAQGRFGAEQLGALSAHDISGIQARLPHHVQGETCYQLFRKQGIDYGEGFKGIREIYYSEEECLSRLEVTANRDYQLPPELLDSALQTCIGLHLAQQEGALRMPFSVKEMNIYGDVNRTRWCHVQKSELHKNDSAITGCDVYLLAENGDVLLYFKEFITLSPDKAKNTGITLTEMEMSVLPADFKQVSVLSDVCYKSILQILIGMGLMKYTSEPPEELHKNLHIINKYDRLFRELIRDLHANKYLTHVDEKISIPSAISEQLDAFDLEEALAKAATDHPEYNAHLQLLKACLQYFPAILKGINKATDIIFPHGSMQLVAGVYNGNPETDYFNEFLCSIVKTGLQNSISQLKKGEQFTLLEVGAGTGGTSKLLFETLWEYKEHIRYIYTDISASFLQYAEEKYKNRAPYLETKLFNIEKAPELQDIDTGSCDMVIGANVLHATREIKTTLINIRPLLKKGGIILLNEIARTEIFATLTFGLLDGWWLYTDNHRRLEGSPGLSANSWKDVLNEAGFDNVIVHPSSGTLTQQIITAINTVQYSKPVPPPVTTAVPSPILNTVPAQKPVQQAMAYLKKIFGRFLKINESRINVEAPFEELGVDSIVIGNLAKELSGTFEDISTITFFEYGNIKDLAAYLANAHLGFFQEKEEEHIPEPVKQTENKKSHRTVNRLRTSGTVQASQSSVIQEKDIAIIGLSGRYPGAENINEFWENLKAGKDCLTEIPKDRWDIDKYYDAQKGKAGKMNSRWGGFIQDVDKFDPQFFKIAPKEAEGMDPQERLFLQTAWEAVEDAGYAVRQLSVTTTGGKVRTGVYVGVMYEEYQLFGAELQALGNPVSLAGSPASIANRVSYCFDLNGPSMAIDTMCSSSLTAIHLACNDLVNGETDTAIAGGVNVSIHPNKYLLLSQNTFLSGRGKCESFGRNGEGFVPAEGTGAVVLKLLSKAEADGDHIYGVIKGSSLNHGGKANGYTVPSPNAQEDVIKRAIEKAGVNPEDFSYIEAHGTGTILGDPIEVAGLSRAFNTANKYGQYCAIGSVKSNIGHAESAAGIAGLTKILLQLKYRFLVPNLHSGTLNKNIDFEKTPFKVQQVLEEWRTNKGKPRLAGISSFGAGGSNAHLIVEEYIPPHKAVVTGETPVAIILSARNSDRLKKQVGNLMHYLHTNPQPVLHDMAYTLQTGREALDERVAFVVNDMDELLVAMRAFLSDEPGNYCCGNIKTQNTQTAADISYLIANRDIRYLGELWIKGFDVDWSLLYDGVKAGRISLPTYPFAKQRYWIVPEKNNGAVDLNNTITPPSDSVSKPIPRDTPGLYYKPLWRKIPGAAINGVEDIREGITVIVGKKNRFLDELASAIRLKGGTVITMEAIEALPTGTRSVFLLQGLYEYAHGEEITAQLNEQEISVFNNIRSLKLNSETQLNMTVITYQTQMVTDRETIQTAGSGIIGLIGSLAKEELRWNIRMLDINRKDTTTIAAILAAPFVKTGDVRAIRDGHYYQQELVPIDQTESYPVESKIKRGGVYVILGGAGGLGKVTSEYLIKNYNAKVYWLGRRELNSEIESAIKALSHYGPMPVYIQCDAADRQSMELACEQIKRKEHRIHGLFHSAIVLHDRMLSNMSERDFRTAFEPKSVSSFNFIEAFRNEQPDFIYFYSSIQSHLNAAGQANYAAGCTYKDSYARMVEQQYGIHCYTINWGYWGEVGVVSAPAYRKRMSQMGIGSINEKDGMEAIEFLLRSKMRQLSVIKLTGEEGVKNLTFLNLGKKIIRQNTVSLIRLAKIPGSTMNLVSNLL